MERGTSSKVHAVVDVDAAARAGWTAFELARAFLDGGLRVLQLRAKHLRSADFLVLCDDVVRLAAPFGAAVIVNDRVDLARMSGAGGVHVGQDDLQPSFARDQLGPDAIIGLSTHTRAQIEDAVRQPVSYIAVGPVFGTATKDTGYQAVGLDLVRAARALAPAAMAIVGIGGITLDRAASVVAAGASQVAVISDLLVSDPRERAAAFVRTLM
jgi:thiamine-phosphate pyrophosphorylase